MNTVQLCGGVDVGHRVTVQDPRDIFQMGDIISQGIAGRSVGKGADLVEAKSRSSRDDQSFPGDISALL